MNKNELIAEVAQNTGMTKADIQRVIEMTLETTKKIVKKGEEVKLIGFGTFLRAKRSARKGRNPQTGKELQIEAHLVAGFRPGAEFKSLMI